MLLVGTAYAEPAREVSHRAYDTATAMPRNATHGGPGHDNGWAIHPLEDGLLLAGWTASTGQGSADGWLLRLDKDGRELWNKTYGGPGNDRIVAMSPTDDGYILAGYTTSYGAGFTDLWLLRTDLEGNERWNRTYGGRDHDNGWAVCTTDGGIAVTGFTASYGAPNSNLWLLHTDSQGNEQWNVTYGGPGCETGFAIEPVGDGYAVAGYYESCGGPYDLWLLHTDGEGTMRWNRTYGGDGIEVARDMAVLDGGFALTGWTSTYGTGGTDAWLLVTDSQGKIMVSRTYGGPGHDGGFAIEPVKDGYAIAGWTASYGAGGQDAWLLATDRDGMMRWEYRTGGPGDDVIYGLDAAGSTFVMTGATDSYGSGRDDLWLLSLDDPQLSIRPRGGLGLSVQVASHAMETRTDIPWTASLDGRIIPGDMMGVIAELPAGGRTTLAIPAFGFGPVTATLTVGDVQRRARFVSLGPFLLPG